VRRRRLVETALLCGGALLIAGHTPYGQWVVYRKKHLLIGCHRADLRTYQLAQEVVGVLEEHLPSARARIARAPTAGRLASLLATDQLETAILGAEDAAAMLAGSDGFAAYGPVPLRLIRPLADRLLLAHAGFPARHAWLVAAALAEPDVATPTAAAGLPWHPGSRAFLDGEPEPPPPE